MRPLGWAPICVLVVFWCHAQAENSLLWHSEPARHFTESTPLGNGRLGAMVYGGIEEETIVLNESGMWSGSPQNADRPNAAAVLPEIRRLLFSGKYVAAEQLMNEEFTCAGKGSGRGGAANLPYGCYQLLGKLRLRFHSETDDAQPKDYRRELDLSRAILNVSFSRAGVDFQREVFISQPDQVLVYKISASKPKSISFDLSLDRPERAKTTRSGENELLMQGQLNDGHDGNTGVRFTARVRALSKDGSNRADGTSIKVRKASSVLLFVSAATDLQNLTTKPIDNPEEWTLRKLDKAAAKSYESLLDQHVADYQKYYDRVQLSLGSTAVANSANLEIGQRLRNYWEHESDNSLPELYFNFGRYILISSSRPGGRPANLQGIWAEELQTPWNGDWHLNINVQMNYWPAEVCNLSELHQPLVRLTESLAKPGSRTAREYYDSAGWVAHVLANPWGFTSPGDQASWGATNTGSAWLCHHLWEHFLYTQDTDFLRRVYPVIKGACEFYMETLVQSPDDQWLVTAPSTSPENSFVTDTGEKGTICFGSTMDMQLIRSLFRAYFDSANILGMDEPFRDRVNETENRVRPTQISADGRVMEWNRDFQESDPSHRHVSHLWGLYPGHEINLNETPDLASAARKTLTVRGDFGTGWAVANKMAMWSRLGNGEKAHELLRNHLRPVVHGESEPRWSGGTYPNLFNSHPPFQIDGNLGATSAIAEMLVQSSPPENGNGKVTVDLLPAIPKAWRTGSVSGLCLRGGFVLAMSWSDGVLSEASFQSRCGLPLRIRCGANQAHLNTVAGQTAWLDGTLSVLKVTDSQE